MPAQQKQSSILARIAAQDQQAYSSVKSTEIEQKGFVDLPAGINNGIALLKGITFGEFQTGNNKGKPYWSAFGIVLEPKQLGAIPIEGLRTKLQPEPLCDTPPAPNKKPAEGARLTKAQHYKYALDHLRILAGEEYLGKSPLPDKLVDLEEWCNKLIKSKIYFRFRTWSGKKQELETRRQGVFVVAGNNTVGGPFPNEEAAKKAYPYVGNDPMVNHTWAGRLEGYEPEEVDHIQESIPSANGAATTTPTTPNGEKDEAPEPFNEFGDMDELAELADGPEGIAKDKAAQDLAEMAESAGITNEVISSTDNWHQVVEMIRVEKGESTTDNDNEGEAAPNETVEESEILIPQRGQVCGLKVLLDPKKPSKGMKELQCEIVAVNEAKQTVDIKNMSDGKTIYKGITWDKLIPSN